MFLHQKIVFSVVFLTSFLPSFALCSSPLCSLSCHPHRFFLLCQSGGCCPTASLFGRGGIKGDLRLFAVLHLRCSSPLCSLSCHPHQFLLLCQSGGCCPTASLFGRGGIKGDLHLFAVLHLRCSPPLCSLSCHPHRFFLLCQSGGFAALLLPYLGGVASKVIFISLLYLFLCTTLVLVYLAWSPCTTLVLVYLAWSPWVYLDIHIRGYIIFWWPSCCLWLKFQWTMQHSTLGYRALIQPATILV